MRDGARLLGQAIRDEPRPFAVSIAGAAVYAGTTVGSAVVFGQVTDRVVLPAFAAGRTSAGALGLASAAVVAVGLLKVAGIFARRVGASLMQYRLEGRWRRAVTRRYAELPARWHRTQSTGALLSTASADIEAAFFPIAPLPLSLGVLLSLAVTAVLLLLTDPLLALVGFSVAPVLVWVNRRYNQVTVAPATRAQQRRAEVAGVAHESIDGALMVKVLGQEAAETARFAERSEALRDEMVHLGRLRGTFDPVMEALPNVAVLAVLGVGTWRLSAGAVTAGQLVQSAYLFTLLAFPVRAIGWVLSELPRALAGWGRVQAVMAAQGRPQHGTALASGRGPAEAALHGVDLAYDDEPVLSGVALRAAEGRVVAVVGPTGAGKSSVAALLVRLIDPSAGAVTLDGVDLRDHAAGAVATATALVFQSAFLFDGTVRDNVALGAPVDEEAVWAALRLAQADRFVAALPQGLDTLVGERGATLSGGQRQRLALARALVRRPRLLVLDDATSAVDTTVEAAILDGLRSADLPATVVVVANRPATIGLADEVVYIEQGRVVAAGAPDELARSVPGYRRLLDAATAGPPAPAHPEAS